MPRFQHILITRFNLRSTQRSWANTNEQWMLDRWAIFTKYCLPSILNQTEKNFAWFIYFDEKTADKFKEKIKQLSKSHSFIRPLFKKNYEAFLNDLAFDIAGCTTDETSHIITSRIDNDDCFHKSAIEVIQQQFSGQIYHIVNLAKGISLEVSPSNKASKYSYYSGPFISLIEQVIKDKPLKTIFEKDHHAYFKDMSITQLESIPYWIQIIHVSNVSNRLRGRPMPLDFSWSDYGIRPPLKKDSNYILRLSFYYLFVFPIIKSKNSLKKILGHPISIK